MRLVCSLSGQAVFYPQPIAVLSALEIPFEFALRFTPEENLFSRMLAFSSSSSPAPFFSACIGGCGQPEEAGTGSSPSSAANLSRPLQLLQRWEDGNCGFAMWGNFH